MPDLFRCLATASSQFDLACSLLAAREIEASIEAFNRAEELGFDADRCSSARWECFMLRGEFQRAWLESDAIGSRGSPDPHALWSGRYLTGKRVVIRCLHGLGDAIQFIRFATLLRAQAPAVIVDVPACLTALLRTVQGVDRVVTWEQPEPYEWDEQVEVMELPRILAVTPETLPGSIPYLFPPSGAIEKELLRKLRADRARKVGLRWESGAWNRDRSIPLSKLASLLQRDDLSFYGLQAGAQESVIPEVIGANLDLLRTAAIIAELDLIITVDTMIAHLAGALGKPVWLMLTHAADWRWMVNRPDSPWYRSMKLFRQSHPGDWASVVQAICSELEL